MIRSLAHMVLLFAVLSWTAHIQDARAADVAVAPDVHIHVIDEGQARADRPTLVLIPGWRFSGTIWSGQIAAFSDEYRVIAIDPRSQGASTKTGEGNTPEQRADDLRTVLARLNVGRFVLVGWSQGVQDVAAYVGRYGTAGIDGIVLVDSTVSDGAAGIARAPDDAARLLGRMSTYADAPREYTEGMMRAIFASALPPARFTRLVDQALATPTATGTAMLIADLLGVNRRPALARMDKPVLAIASPRSGELAGQREMAARLADAEFHVVDGAGHVVFVDQPERFNALLRAFLARIGRGR